MKAVLLSLLILFIVSCENSSEKIKKETDKSVIPETPVQKLHEKKSKFFKSLYEVRVVESSLGWGYEIWKEGVMVINQTHIPAIQGLRAFESQVQAEKAAEIIKIKLDQGVFPPSISIGELQSIGVNTN
jgi:hypothetical protein